MDARDQLLVAARAGDQDSFARLIEPYIAPGYRLAVSMLNDPGHAEDVLQEATLRAWRAVGKLSASSRMGPWFLSIVANRSRSVRGARWWSVVRLPLANANASSSTEAADQRTDLISALHRLSPDERAAIYLRFFEDMNSEEVGEVLGISGAGARSRIHRALKKMRVDRALEVQ